MEDRIIAYGGQAVIEGVMMRGRAAMAIAMRAPDGKIVLHTEKLGSLYRSRIAKIPFVRGVMLLWDALGLGHAGADDRSQYADRRRREAGRAGPVPDAGHLHC